MSSEIEKELKKKPAPKSAKLIFSTSPVVSPSLDGIEVFIIEEDEDEALENPRRRRARRNRSHRR